MKVTVQYFLVVLFVNYAVKSGSYGWVRAWNPTTRPFKYCRYSWVLLSWDIVYYIGPNFWVCEWNPEVWPFKWSCLLRCTRWLLLLSIIMDEILKYDHSNESYWAVLSCVAVYYAVQGGSTFWVCGWLNWNPKVWPFTWKLLSSTFLRLAYKSSLESAKRDRQVHSKRSKRATLRKSILSYAAVYYAVQGDSDF